MAAILSRPQCVKGAPGQQPFGFFFSWQDQCPCSNNVPCMTCIALLGDYGSWLHGVHIENIPPNKWRWCNKIMIITVVSETEVL